MIDILIVFIVVCAGIGIAYTEWKGKKKYKALEEISVKDRVMAVEFQRTNRVHKQIF